MHLARLGSLGTQHYRVAHCAQRGRTRPGGCSRTRTPRRSPGESDSGRENDCVLALTAREAFSAEEEELDEKEVGDYWIEGDWRNDALQASLNDNERERREVGSTLYP